MEHSIMSTADNGTVRTSRIASLAILDMETSNLPTISYNKVSITELSIFGFSVGVLGQPHYEIANKIPDLPRVLHKLTLLFNPMRRISNSAEYITELNNYMLESETKLNENAANLIIGFLRHLPQPVCIVAHNGLRFDFPILKCALKKCLPSLEIDFLCVDSLNAIRDIDCAVTAVDEPNNAVETPPRIDTELLKPSHTEQTEVDSGTDLLINIQFVDWRTINETTPKRIRMSVDECVNPNGHKPATIDKDSVRKCCRKLFEDENVAENRPSQRQKYPKKNVYKLGSIYERIFQKPADKLHNAESDVEVLTKIVLHYGTDFLEYSEKYAIPIRDI